MKLDDIISLTKAGFTAEQINKMIDADTTPAAPTEPETAVIEPENNTETQPAPAAEPDEVTKALIKSIEDINSRLDEIGNNLKMPAMPSIGNVQPKGIDDIVRNFFKEE